MAMLAGPPNLDKDRRPGAGPRAGNIFHFFLPMNGGFLDQRAIRCCSRAFEILNPGKLLVLLAPSTAFSRLIRISLAGCPFRSIV